MTHPQLRWLDGLKRLHDLLSHGFKNGRHNKPPRTLGRNASKGEKDRGQSVELAVQLESEINAAAAALLATTLQVSWPLIGDKIGSYNRKFAQKMAQVLQGSAAREGSRSAAPSKRSRGPEALAATDSSTSGNQEKEEEAQRIFLVRDQNTNKLVFKKIDLTVVSLLHQEAVLNSKPPELQWSHGKVETSTTLNRNQHNP